MWVGNLSEVENISQGIVRSGLLSNTRIVEWLRGCLPTLQSQSQLSMSVVRLFSLVKSRLVFVFDMDEDCERDDKLLELDCQIELFDRTTSMSSIWRAILTILVFDCSICSSRSFKISSNGQPSESEENVVKFLFMPAMVAVLFRDFSP